MQNNLNHFFNFADLSNIFESFLPQLLTYPNPIDPLNGDAAAMYLHKPDDYKKKVQDYVKKYATEEALREQEAHDAAHLSSDSESSMSDFSEDEAQDMELWDPNSSFLSLIFFLLPFLFSILLTVQIHLEPIELIIPASSSRHFFFSISKYHNCSSLGGLHHFFF